MNPIIKIENLSKQYRLGIVGTGTMSNDLKRWWYRTRGKEDPFLKIGESKDLASKENSDYVWALRDINLEVMPGEVLGIIGKNGAGKSTLLKILSKVTGPTTGSISFNGRIGSLLEVGTGFHAELTGRENIFLNGAILGMNKSEIRSKLDEIIDFSGVEQYIDTPVKRYSSGMMVRLGFAVAAHLEPEILVVDEVLAVGDAEFQKKAVGKMKEVSRKEKRTVLFVSHNMSAIQNLCDSAILLNKGKINFIGDTNATITRYLQLNKEEREDIALKDKKREGKAEITFENISVLNNNQITIGSNLTISITLKNNTGLDMKGVRVDIGIDSNFEVRIAHLSTQTLNLIFSIPKYDSITLHFKIDKLSLVSGTYGLTLYCENNGQTQDWIKNAFYFNVENADYYLSGKLPPPNQGNILLNYEIEQAWNILK